MLNVKSRFNKAVLTGAAIGLPVLAKADITDVGGVVDQLVTWKGAVLAIGVALLLWQLGKRVAKRFM